jgi:hypothetical protein
MGEKMMRIAEIWNSRDESVWRQALKRYWDYVRPANLALEKELDALGVESVRRMSAQEWYDFLYHRYFRWKYTAPNRLATTRKRLQQYAETGSLDELYEIKERLFSFDTGDIRDGLQSASQIKGLGISGASGLLSILFPDQFGTADQFVVKALRNIGTLREMDALMKMNPEGLKLSDGVLLIKIMRAKADENNRIFATDLWTPRRIDMILWTYGR